MQGNGPRDPRPAEDRPGASRPPADRPVRARPDADRGGDAARPGPSTFEVAERKRRNGLIVRLVLGLVLLVLFVIFVSLNSDSVPVHFIFTETRTPLVWVFLICALIGALVAFLLGRPGRRASKKYIRELERRLEDERSRRP